MIEAKIVHFEDDKSLRELIPLILEKYGHTVVRAAATMDEARELIENLDPNVTLAIIDGNLSSERTGEDGAEIVRLLKEKNEHIVTIGFSGSNKVEGADYQVIKGNGLTLIAEQIELIELS